MSQTVSRPALSFPPKVAALVRETYAAATTILEYGSGGSTVLAAELPGKTIFSVESDPDWIAMMRGYLRDAAPPSPVRLHHADIGPIGKWGRPRDRSGWRRYHTYPLSVFDRDDFVAPDVILIDGRFRPACLFAALMRITAPVTVLFDDYTSRAQYRVVEQLATPTETRGRMARFDITPTPWPADKLTLILEQFTRPS